MPRKQILSPVPGSGKGVLCDCSRPVYFADPGAEYRLVVWEPRDTGSTEKMIENIIQATGAELTRYVAKNRDILLEGPFGKREVQATALTRYPQLDEEAQMIAEGVVRLVNNAATKRYYTGRDAEMPYKAQCILELVIAKLQEKV